MDILILFVQVIKKISKSLQFDSIWNCRYHVCTVAWISLFFLSFMSVNIFVSSSQLTEQRQTRSFFRQHIFLLHLSDTGYLRKHKDCYFGSHLIPPAQFLLYLNDWIGFQFRSELRGQPCDVYIGYEDVRIAHGSLKQNLLLV